MNTTRIRRSDLARDVRGARPSAGTYADDAAERVKRGESVRVTGLGTLATVVGQGHREVLDPQRGWVPQTCDRSWEANAAARPDLFRLASYRLTLTAAVAKACGIRAPGDVPSIKLAKAWHTIETDVHHLARALGAPVEVWAPWKPKKQGEAHTDDRPITTVAP